MEPIKIDPFKEKSAGLGQAAAKEEQCRNMLKLEQARLDAYKVNFSSCCSLILSCILGKQHAS